MEIFDLLRTLPVLGTYVYNIPKSVPTNETDP